MHSTTLCGVGGSVMVAVPPALLELLHLRAGTTVGVTVEDGRFVIDPRPRPRYTLAERLVASDYSQPQLPQNGNGSMLRPWGANRHEVRRRLLGGARPHGRA